MSALLDGHLLNGAAYPSRHLWAWGWARAEASATAEPVVNRVYSDARGDALAHAEIDNAGYRRAFLAGTSEAGAEADIVATRYAPVDGVASGEAATTARIVGLVYVSARARADADSNGYGDRAKQFVGTTSAYAEAVADELLTRRHARVDGRKLPGQARTWLAESAVDRLHVKQQYARSTAVGRSYTRAIANSTIGRGRLELDSRITANDLKVNIYHDFRGCTAAVAEGVSKPDRLRIIIGGALGTAEARLAPTIERDGERYSYNSGVAAADATTVDQAYVARRLRSEPMKAEALWGSAETYWVRGMRGVSRALADTRMDADANLWQWGKGTANASASIQVEWQHYRWRVADLAAADGQALTHAENIRSRWGDKQDVAALASSEAVPYAERRVAGGTEAWADCTETANVIRPGGPEAAEAQADIDAGRYAEAFMFGASEALAGVEFDVWVNRFRNGASESEAATTADGVANRYVHGPVEGIAASGIEAHVERFMGGDVRARAETRGDNWVMSYARAGVHAIAAVDIVAHGYRGRLMTGAIEAQAETIGNGLRFVIGVADPEPGVACTSRFIYRINIDGDAPVRRTIELPPSMRHLALPASNREYRVT